MKIALVHDQLLEYGGAERVLQELCEMFPQAPIYTAFAVKNSTAMRHFQNKTIIESKLAPILKFHKLYSPLRFLAPWIWEGFDFTDYDLVISSASWYITKGIITPPNCAHFCYCHTPPRYLYGFPTAIELQRYPLIKLYAKIINKFLKRYDFVAAARVDQFMVNSQNVADRVKKFYGRDSIVIYPPILVEEIKTKTQDIKKENYYLIVSRVVGAKGIDLAMKAANKLKFPLKIVGETAGLKFEAQKLQGLKSQHVEFLGRVSDKDLWQIYAKAKGFLALASDEDFGMTVVESQAAGTPVIAYYGGGYKETIVDGITGLFFKEYKLDSLCQAVAKFEKMKFNKADLYRNADKFSKENFRQKIQEVIKTRLGHKFSD